MPDRLELTPKVLSHSGLESLTLTKTNSLSRRTFFPLLSLLSKRFFAHIDRFRLLAPGFTCHIRNLSFTLCPPRGNIFFQDFFFNARPSNLHPHRASSRWEPYNKPFPPYFLLSHVWGVIKIRITHASTLPERDLELKSYLVNWSARSHQRLGRVELHPTWTHTSGAQWDESYSLNATPRAWVWASVNSSPNPAQKTIIPFSQSVLRLELSWDHKPKRGSASLTLTWEGTDKTPLGGKVSC